MKEAKISEHDVQHVAGLAKLNILEEEIETFTNQLNHILVYMDKLNELDTSGVEPMSHVIDMWNAFRDDMIRESFSQETSLCNAPDKANGLFKVPRIIGE